MQRGGAEAARGPSGKRGGGRRGGARRVLSVVCSPLAAVALFAALLLYSSHRFSHFSSTAVSAGESGFFDGRSGSKHSWQHAGGSAADPAQTADAGSGHSGDVLASLKQQAQQQQTHRSSWLTAALLWAEEHHAARTKAKVCVGGKGGAGGARAGKLAPSWVASLFHHAVTHDLPTSSDQHPALGSPASCCAGSAGSECEEQLLAYSAGLPPPCAACPLAPTCRTQASVYQAPTGCGLLPCQGQQLQRPRTLVVYVYNAGGQQAGGRGL